MRVQLIRRFGFLLLLAVSVACGGGGPQRGENEARAFEFAEQIAASKGGLPEPQAKAFEDGEITFEEYEAAAFAYHDCVESTLGLQPQDLEFEQDRQQYDWTYAVGDPFELHTCYHEWFSEIDGVWQAITDDRYGERDEGFVSSRVEQCLRDLGLEPDADASLPELLQQLTDAGSTGCLGESSRG